MSDLIKSKDRVWNLGEVYTPPHIVNAMLDLIPEEITIQMTFFEPACGNGNFLAEILKRKLAKAVDELDVIDCLKSIYAVDIMQDNVDESKNRLFSLVNQRLSLAAWFEAAEVLDKNIQVGDTINQPEKIMITCWSDGNVRTLADMIKQENNQQSLFSFAV